MGTKINLGAQTDQSLPALKGPIGGNVGDVLTVTNPVTGAVAPLPPAGGGGGDIKSDGSVPFAANESMSGFMLTSLKAVKTEGFDGVEQGIDRSLYAQRSGITVFFVGIESSLGQDTVLYLSDPTGAVTAVMAASISAGPIAAFGSVLAHDVHIRVTNIERVRITPSLLQLTGVDLNFNNQYGINLLDPVNPQDAVTKNYVDARTVIREIPVGVVDGVNTVFDTAFPPIAGSECVFQNVGGAGGTLKEDGGVDYTIAGTTITFTVAPAIGDIIRVNYLK